MRATENCQLRNYFFFSHFCNYRWKCIFCRNSVHLFPAEYRYRTILFSKQKKYINFTLSKGVLSGSYLRMQIRFSSLPFTSLFVLHPIKHSVSQLLIGSLRGVGVFFFFFFLILHRYFYEMQNICWVESYFYSFLP